MPRQMRCWRRHTVAVRAAAAAKRPQPRTGLQTGLSALCAAVSPKSSAWGPQYLNRKPGPDRARLSSLKIEDGAKR